MVMISNSPNCQRVPTDWLCETIQPKNYDHEPVTSERLDSAYIALESRFASEFRECGILHNKFFLQQLVFHNLDNALGLPNPFFAKTGAGTNRPYDTNSIMQEVVIMEIDSLPVDLSFEQRPLGLQGPQLKSMTKQTSCKV